MKTKVPAVDRSPTYDSVASPIGIPTIISLNCLVSYFVCNSIIKSVVSISGDGPDCPYYMHYKKDNNINPSRYKFKSSKRHNRCLRVKINSTKAHISSTFQNGCLPTEPHTVKNRLLSFFFFARAYSSTPLPQILDTPLLSL